MRCLLIDDNTKTAGKLSRLLLEQPGIAGVQTVLQPYMIRSILMDESADLVFSRVRLWNFRAYCGVTRMPAIVFLCGGRDKLTDRPESTVPYKLREPYTGYVLEQFVKRIRTERIIEKPGYCFVRYEGRFHRMFFADIELIERKSMGYVIIYTKHSSMLVPGTLTSWIQQLPEDRFIRISDTLVVPVQEAMQTGESYFFRGREIKLTFRFAAAARKEMATKTFSHVF